MRVKLLIAVAQMSCAVCGATDFVRHVRTEMGTVNTGGREGCCVSTGNLYPMTARPWGFGDHANWSFLPVTGEPAAEAKDRASWYSHKTEHFGPDRAAVMIANISGKRWRHGFDFGPWRIDTVRVVDDENTYGLVTGLPPELGDESVWIVTLDRGQDR